MKTLEDILKKHCPSMDRPFLDKNGVAFRERIFDAMREYACEVAQSTLEKAAENSILKLTFSSGEIVTNPTWKMHNGELIELQKSSITNPNNITLL